MVNRKNRCTSILSASGSSSCSDYYDHCCKKKFNNICCCDQCELINERNYTTLRKICHKIFKDYNRAQCREKYTIFDGGNSINVRIHRSGSRGDEDRYSDEQRYRLQNKHNNVIGKDGRGRKLTGDEDRYGKASDEQRYRLQNKHNNVFGKDGRGGKLTGIGYGNSTDQKYEKVSNEDRQQLQNKHNKIISQDGRVSKISGRKPGRDGEKFDSDVDVYNRDQTKRGKGKNTGIDVTDDNGYDKRNKKLQNTIRGEGKDNGYNDQNYNEQTLKGKLKFSQGIDTNGNRNGERDINGKAIENRKSKSRKDTNKGESWSDSKRGARDDNESDENYNGKGKLSSRGSKKDAKKSKPLKKGETGYKDDDMIIAEMAKTKNRKEKNKYSVDKDDAFIRSDDEVTNKRKYIKGKKSKGYEDDIDNFDITANNGSERNSRKSKNKRANKYRRSQSFDDVGKSNERNYHVINNLRKKPRKGDNVDLNNGSSFSHTRKQTKHSRADEVRTCDYLRALMEQRDLCHCQCFQKCSQFNPTICIPRTCMSTCGPKTVTSCFSETCEC